MERTKVTYKDLYIFFIIIYILCLSLNAINIGVLGSALKIVAVMPIAIALFCGRNLKFTTSLTAQLLFTLFAFFSLVWSISFDVSLKRCVSYILLFALLLSGAAFKYTERELQKVKCAMVWSSRITAVVVLVFARYIRGRLWLVGIISEDPNYLCAYFIFGVTYALGILTEDCKIYRKIFAAVELILYFYLVLASGSRGGLIAIMAAIVAYFMMCDKNKMKHIAKNLLLLALAFGAIIMLINHLPEELGFRFTVDNVMEDGGSGRVDLWKQTVDLFVNGNIFRQIFGFGTATIMDCFRRYGYSEINVSHNMFLETLAELGVIGLVIYSCAIFAFIKASLKHKDKFAFSVIFGMFAMSLSTSIYTFKPYFNIMLFIIMIQNVKYDLKPEILR